MMKEIFQTPRDGYHYFNGYYDKSPLSHDNRYLLALRTKIFDKMPDGVNDLVEVGYFDLLNESGFYKIDENQAFNWQQGNMLQWIGYSEFSCGYNVLKDGDYFLRIKDIFTKDFVDYPIPAYSISPCGSHYVSVNFKRHTLLRPGYSYSCIKDDKHKSTLDFVKLCELNSNKVTELFNISAFDTLSDIKGGLSYIEHCMYCKTNPKRFLFYLRNKTEASINTKLFWYDLNKKKIHEIKGATRVTHANWVDEDNIIFWGATHNATNTIYHFLSRAPAILRFLLKIYRFFIKGNGQDGNSRLSSALTGDSYKIYTISTQSFKDVATKISVDGHPSMHPLNSELLITDSYPNKDSISRLMLYNIKEDNFIESRNIDSSPEINNSPFRCDLHPKVSNDGNHVIIDSSDGGYRSIKIFQINAY